MVKINPAITIMIAAVLMTGFITMLYVWLLNERDELQNQNAACQQKVELLERAEECREYRELMDELTAFDERDRLQRMYEATGCADDTTKVKLKKGLKEFTK